MVSRFRKLLTPLDAASTGFLSLLIVLCLAFYQRVDEWASLVAVDVGVILLIVALAWQADRRQTSGWVHLHRWYCYPIVLFVFKQIHLMVRPIHPVDYDHVLIAIDRWLFGLDPTVWISQFSHPILTEILQTAYFLYYLLFIILGVGIYRKYPIREFDHAAFLIVYGFYLSYVGYFLLPAIGPRFTLHDYHALNTEMPGIFFTNFMRDFVDAGESIPKGVLNPEDFVQRDVFPSGHTQLTTLTVFLAFRYRLSLRWVMVVIASLLIVATVYLRYHYVIDLIGGIAFFGLTIWTGDRFQMWWESKRVVSRVD